MTTSHKIKPCDVIYGLRTALFVGVVTRNLFGPYPLGQCVSRKFSEFRSYRKTKFSTPEIPDFNGTKTVVPNSENFRETYRNCYRNSGPKPLSEITPEFSSFSKFPVEFPEPLLKIENSGLNRTRPAQIRLKTYMSKMASKPS